MAQLATYAGGRIKLLSLTGGEPFYDLERLRTLAAGALPFSIAVCTVDEAEPRYQALL
ncbi:MAG: hypothetical protein PWR31_943 [Bacillota bacterium]|nr:hypothetical protein [Bacillota bacterium]